MTERRPRSVSCRSAHRRSRGDAPHARLAAVRCNLNETPSAQGTRCGSAGRGAGGLTRDQGPALLPPRPAAASDTEDVKRAIVRAMAVADEVLDEVLYRPAVVKAFAWLPRWWCCDLAKLSTVLDDRWNVDYWERTGIAPGRSCDACARRASIHVVGGRDDEFS